METLSQIGGYVVFGLVVSLFLGLAVRYWTFLVPGVVGGLLAWLATVIGWGWVAFIALALVCAGSAAIMYWAHHV